MEGREEDVKWILTHGRFKAYGSDLQDLWLMVSDCFRRGWEFHVVFIESSEDTLPEESRSKPQ